MSSSNKREPRLAKPPPPSGQSRVSWPITKGVVSVLTVCFNFLFFSRSGEQAGKGAVGSPQVEYLVGTSPVCSRIPGLSPGQRKFCQLYQDHMRSVMRGAAAAVSECRWQFNFRRWNCSALNKKNIFNRASKGGKLEIVNRIVERIQQKSVVVAPSRFSPERILQG